MDNVSVSRGTFSEQGAYELGRRKSTKPPEGIFDREPWFKAYKNSWAIIEKAVEEIRTNMSEKVLIDLKNYVAELENNPKDRFLTVIRTAILLTGVNLPDHEVLFHKISHKLSSVTEHIAVIQSRDSSNMKNLIEETVFQLMSGIHEGDLPLKKNQCTLQVLENWYWKIVEDNLDTPLVIIIPDFEGFNPAILRDFITALSSSSLSDRFVLIFGVATTLHAVHRSLSYDVTSKLSVQVFHTLTQANTLSHVLEGTVLSGKAPFNLTGRAFKLLTDIFLYYNYSLNGFLQGYKFCMIQHFYGNNLTALCCKSSEKNSQIAELSESDFIELRKLPSIVKCMEKIHGKSKSEMNHVEFQRFVLKVLDEFHEAMSGFFPILKCLHYLTSSLPGAPMGKELREVYADAVTCDLTKSQGYRESMQLLGFLSKEELLEKLTKILEMLENVNNNRLNNIYTHLLKHMEIIENASLEVVAADSSEILDFKQNQSRSEFQEKMRKMSQKQSRSPFKQAAINLLEYLDQQVFSVHLVNPNRLVGSEIFCFSDAQAGKHHLRGSLRAAIHTALNDPQAYIHCDCCKLDTEERILPTFPDLSIIYKLHLEPKKLINMYDWLQAFISIVDPDDEEEQREVDPKMQARFTQAVAELQFLGFIKTSRKKTDHVKRLT